MLNAENRLIKLVFGLPKAHGTLDQRIVNKTKSKDFPTIQPTNDRAYTSAFKIAPMKTKEVKLREHLRENTKRWASQGNG